MEILQIIDSSDTLVLDLLDNGVRVYDWTPKVTQYKDGGRYSNPALSDYKYMTDKQSDTAIEELTTAIYSSTAEEAEAKLVYIVNVLEEISNLWIEDNDPYYLKWKNASTSEVRYAALISGRVDNLEGLTGDTVLNTGFNFVLEGAVKGLYKTVLFLERTDWVKSLTADDLILECNLWNYSVDFAEDKINFIDAFRAYYWNGSTETLRNSVDTFDENDTVTVDMSMTNDYDQIRLYFGGQYKFKNIELETIAATFNDVYDGNPFEGYSVELWSGSDWIQWTDTNELYPNIFFGRFDTVPGKHLIPIKLPDSEPTWEMNTINGLNRYWVRISIEKNYYSTAGNSVTFKKYFNDCSHSGHLISGIEQSSILNSRQRLEFLPPSTTYMRASKLILCTHPYASAIYHPAFRFRVEPYNNYGDVTVSDSWGSGGLGYPGVYDKEAISPLVTKYDLDTNDDVKFRLDPVLRIYNGNYRLMLVASFESSESNPLTITLFSSNTGAYIGTKTITTSIHNGIIDFGNITFNLPNDDDSYPGIHGRIQFPTPIGYTHYFTFYGMYLIPLDYNYIEIEYSGELCSIPVEVDNHIGRKYPKITNYFKGGDYYDQAEKGASISRIKPIELTNGHRLFGLNMMKYDVYEDITVFDMVPYAGYDISVLQKDKGYYQLTEHDAFTLKVYQQETFK